MKRLAVLTLLAFALDAASAGAQPGQFLGKSSDEWAAKLRNGPDAKTRRNAAFALGKIGPRASDTTGDLLKGLSDNDPMVREAAAFALGEIHKGSAGATVIDALIAALNGDADDMVKRSAAVALGSIGRRTPQVQAALTKAFESKSPAVKQNVAWALGRVGDETVPTLRQALRDNDANVRRDAAGSLQLLGVEAAKNAVPELAGCVQHPDIEVKKAALVALVRLVGPGDADIAKEIVPALSDKDVEVRRNAALALGNIGGERGIDAVPVLREILR